MRLCSCGHENIEEAEFCAMCGKKLNVEKCVRCDKPVIKDAKYCPYCGMVLDGSGVCPECDGIIPNGETYCVNCGYGLNGKRKCLNCGTELDGEYEFCLNCGTIVKKSAKRQTEKKQSADIKSKSGYSKVFTLIRKWLLVAVALSMLFVSLFASTVKMENEDIGTGYGDVDIKLDTFGFIEAISDGKDISEVTKDFTEFIEDEGIVKIPDDDEIGALINKFNLGEKILVAAYDNLPITKTMIILMMVFGILLILSTATFFALSLANALRYTISGKEKAILGDGLFMGLSAGLGATFILFGAEIGGGALAILLLGLITASVSTAIKYVVDRKKPCVKQLVKTAVALTLLLTCSAVATSSAIKLEANYYSDIRTSTNGYGDFVTYIYEGKKVEEVDFSIFDIIDVIDYNELGKENLGITSDTFAPDVLVETLTSLTGNSTEEERELAFIMTFSPGILPLYPGVNPAGKSSAAASALILLVVALLFMIITCAGTTIFINDLTEQKTKSKWAILLFPLILTVLALIGCIISVALCDILVTDWEIKNQLKYVLQAGPIVNVVLALGNFIQYLLLKVKADDKPIKENSKKPKQTETIEEYKGYNF